MKRTIKIGYVIKDEDGDYFNRDDFWDDYGEIHLDKHTAKETVNDLKEFNPNVKLVKVIMCEIEEG